MMRIPFQLEDVKAQSYSVSSRQTIIFPLTSLVAKKLPGAPSQLVWGWSPTKEYRNSFDEAVQLTLY